MGLEFKSLFDSPEVAFYTTQMGTQLSHLQAVCDGEIWTIRVEVEFDAPFEETLENAELEWRAEIHREVLRESGIRPDPDGGIRDQKGVYGCEH